MGFALFMAFCTCVVIVGFIYVGLTIRHHYRLSKAAKNSGEKI